MLFLEEFQLLNIFGWKEPEFHHFKWRFFAVVILEVLTLYVVPNNYYPISFLANIQRSWDVLVESFCIVIMNSKPNLFLYYFKCFNVSRFFSTGLMAVITLSIIPGVNTVDILPDCAAIWVSKSPHQVYYSVFLRSLYNRHLSLSVCIKHSQMSVGILE